MVEHILRASLERSLIITIIYSGGTGISERNIRVLEIQGNNIKAYCYLRKQLRYFKRENILSAAYWEERFRAIS